ncbi:MULTISPECIES: response regulator transcription factor [unclassified Crossiella]|uniref:response regulator transcription factor n=1 Tax=unclassified Crossiella TaxID=2620835 RepID=UPI001FFF8A2F|nr:MULTISPECIES: response regulator transcription factor [unclassified Crossiella]MCK2241399.1 response regulator transcription factor [Crossiella sp. S99.2]MCK2253457.1 response regulator transcription factor [Crossiella sp. S99.1]
MRVLVAEDEVVLAELVASGLRAEAMAVDVVHDGLDAQERLAVHDYDVLVLDRDLPGRHGDDVCAELATQGSRTKVLMLTAAGSLEDKVDGLQLGADDYLTKPFEYPELLARVQALGRRSQPALPPVLVRNGVRLDVANRLVSRDGRRIDLSPKEFAVLSVLLRAQGAVVSSERLLELAWDEHADPFTNAVRVAMSKLRAKLGEPPVIETVPSAGYRI